MAEKKIPLRSEVAEKDTWDLTDLYASDEAWLADLEDMKKLPEKVAAFAGTLGRSAADLLAYCKCGDEVGLRLEKLYGYASRKSDEDSTNSKYQDFSAQAMGVYVAVSSADAFSTPEIMAIPEETITAFFNECEELAPYKRNIEKIRSRAKHILSSEEERILAAAGEISESPENIASMLRNADQKFEPVTDREGNVHPLSNGSLTTLLESSDVNFRREVFRKYYAKIAESQNTAAAALNAQFKQLKFFSSMRKYENTLEAALDRTEVPVNVYTNLISAVHQNLEPMYKYVRLRKKLLNLPELHMYDVYTPIVADAASEISFEDAKKTVVDALGVLGKDYTDLLQEGFDHRWIDVYENVGKRSGAYSAGARPHPYVLMNYQSNLDSEFTLAHEMGHSIHSYYSQKNQPVATSDYVIFVAEVASTCNEVLLMKYLLSKTQDKTEKAYLINHFLDSFKGTIYRQTMFAEFEMIMGQMCERGEALTADKLSAEYKKLNELYFGPDMISDPEIALEWARIPHFFYNYYVFQYATGYSAAVAIANRILAEGEPAVADYKKFLSSGCSMDPISLLKIAGVDMSTPEPVTSALTLFGELVDELGKLMD